ncbi:prepilin-type N-terminal cleavage/methylation domain-containing protein [Mangrovibacter plantisponsor]|uniref:Prepilin peptidase dependent protein C n=1 Tax=Mangrovibacter plantisponsor TaxID=451513 RepID=A0A317Q7A3_9ENTR|nr:prepilin-type N-terminal cleavage/methylation domain-containing protein [Mangrovibacter plantisponsor]PWW12722.1 prepilin peptidase dependent protein C [Mangrovibacter plantisponsor]
MRIAVVCNQQGFSLVETLAAVVMSALMLAALVALQHALSQGIQAQREFLMVGRFACQQVNVVAPDLPEGWLLSRSRREEGACFTLQVQLVSPGGRQGELSRLHCPLAR